MFSERTHQFLISSSSQYIVDWSVSFFPQIEKPNGATIPAIVAAIEGRTVPVGGKGADAFCQDFGAVHYGTWEAFARNKNDNKTVLTRAAAWPPALLTPLDARTLLNETPKDQAKHCTATYDIPNIAPRNIAPKSIHVVLYHSGNIIKVTAGT